jgi:type IV pilus assembly protein PilA
MRISAQEHGFTLVELMVVVLIIGILVAIAIPVFNSASWTARQRTCFANQRTLEGAAQQWVAGGTPTAPRDIVDLDSIGTLVSAGYIAETPVCPSGGTYSMTDGIVAACTEPASDPHGHY